MKLQKGLKVKVLQKENYSFLSIVDSNLKVYHP